MTIHRQIYDKFTTGLDGLTQEEPSYNQKNHKINNASTNAFIKSANNARLGFLK